MNTVNAETTAIATDSEKAFARSLSFLVEVFASVSGGTSWMLTRATSSTAVSQLASSSIHVQDYEKTFSLLGM